MWNSAPRHRQGVGRGRTRRRQDGRRAALLDGPSAAERGGGTLGWCSVAFVGDFVRIELGPNEIIRTSLRDGKDQYYVMDLGDARIGNPVDPDWFPDADLPGAPLLQLIVYASSI